MARPRKPIDELRDIQIAFYVDQELADFLDEQCRKLKMSRSQYIASRLELGRLDLEYGRPRPAGESITNDGKQESNGDLRAAKRA